MRIPAIRSKIGTWTYYITTLTFEQVAQYVSKINDELYQSHTLSDLIQRSITNNYLSIKEYILNQPDVFFNSLVLAVYDDYPQWKEIEFKYEDNSSFLMGLLEFPGNHKVFPVDGQHRVEGIKAALEANPELKNERIAAIFIGHKHDLEGKKRTRRLFTTLNRYAKPVKDDDIIALDEDDIAAIITRNLLEDLDLFTGERVVYAKQKALPVNNKEAITSIITLYQAHCAILKIWHRGFTGEKKLTKKRFERFLKYRRPDSEINSFREYCIGFWNAFKSLEVVSEYLEIDNNAAENFRSNETGGNLIFRPIGFLPLVKAALTIHERTGCSYTEIFQGFRNVNMEINQKPWVSVLWNQLENKMLMGAPTLTILLLLYQYDPTILNAKELAKLKESYAAQINYDGIPDDVLNDLA